MIDISPSKPNSKKPELLSPAGNITAFKSAAKGGADAVYIGLQKFSARGSAENFTFDEIKNLRSESNPKIYVALNTVIFDNELTEFEKTVEKLATLGVDAVILQDIGCASIVKKYGIQLHASTQMSVHSIYGCDVLKSMGFDRVVLARELPYDSLKSIVSHCKQIGLETEIFVHGAQCFAMSGQCYMSAMFGGLSANRGYCASACRLPFKTGKSSKDFAIGAGKIGKDSAIGAGKIGGNSATGANKIGDSHCLSLRDLCLVSHIDKIKTIGIDSVKIEGRMKSPEYVFETTKAFRNAIDGNEFDMKKLQKVSVQRGFSDSFFTGKNFVPKNSDIRNLKPKFPDKNISKIPLRVYADKLTELNPNNFKHIILPLTECEKTGNSNSKNIIIIKPPRLDFEPEKTFARLRKLKENGFDRLLVNNLAYVQIGKKLNFKLHGDFGLNVTNLNSVNFLGVQNFEDITLSFELRKEKINAICRNLHGKIKIGIIAYGNLPLMMSRTCPIGDCKNCSHKITDRKNKTFFVSCKGGYVEICNSDSLDIIHRLSEFDIDFATVLPSYSNAKTNGLYFRSVK
jgi:collagenase-like PrtC family protease